MFYKLFSDNNNIFLNLSISLILFVFLIFLFSYTGFIIKLPINCVYVVLSFILSSFFLYYLSKKENNSKISISIFFLVIFISLICANIFYDASWDGKQYHQYAISVLKNSYNPIYDIVPVKYNVGEKLCTWVQCYPKFAEIVEANFALFFNNIEIGKILNYIYYFASFFLALYVIRTFKNIYIGYKIILAFMLVYNPVCICQLPTFYIDIFVYLSFLNCILLIILMEKGQQNKLLNMFLVINGVILANLKMTGLLYSALILGGYFIYKLFFKNREEIKRTFSIGIITVGLIFFTGINPYYTNYKLHSNPFYPLLGSNKIDIMTEQLPSQFTNKGYLYKMYYSLFGNVSNSTLLNDDTVVKIKSLFSFANQGNFTSPDMRIGGFGYFFGIIIIITAFIILLIRNDKEENNKVYYLVLVILILSIILNPESWWARLSPQMYMIPVIVLIYQFNNTELKKREFIFILMLLILVNSLFVEVENSEKKYTYKYKVNRILNILKENEPVLIYERNSIEEPAFYEKLTERNIEYMNVSQEYYMKNTKDFKIVTSSLSENIMWAPENDK